MGTHLPCLLAGYHSTGIDQVPLCQVLVLDAGQKETNQTLPSLCELLGTDGSLLGLHRALGLP